MALKYQLGVVLVNWNRWADTIECLESLLHSTIPLRIVVVDNASTDGSANQIEGWAAGAVSAAPHLPSMAGFSTPHTHKPIDLERIAADNGTPVRADRLITLIEAPDNLGFAAGNNLGLQALFSGPSIDYVWLLNNDTVVETDAASALVARMDATHDVGMCGTVVRYYHRADTVQALNGSYFSLLTGQSRGIGAGQSAATPFDPARVARDTDFVLGASLAISRGFFERIGQMNESYFLYYEEIDWAYRNAGQFAIAFAHGAIVYHKEGASIGSSGVKGQRSSSSDYYMMRSRLAFIRRRVPLMLPLHWLLAIGQIFRRLLRLQPKKALVLARALLGLGQGNASRGLR